MIEQIIKQFREYVYNKGMTQEEAAHKLDITQEHLSRIFNNKRTPSMTLLRKMENLMEADNNGR